MKPPLIIIVGPTAAGKSVFAVRLARKFNGEVVSADSRQVYRGLDIGTGKISTREMRGVPHHLLDVADPRQQFSVVEFQRLARRAIRDIVARGRLPILVGGTGFWVDAVAYGLQFPAVPPNHALRRRLAEKRASQLLALLHRLDPERAKTIEPQNPRRLIRAIEIARALGHVPSVKKRSPYRTLWIGVALPPEALKQRIRKRLEKRMRHGMVAEVKRLRSRGLSWKRLYELGFEYRYLADYLRGHLTKQQMMYGLEGAIWRYARRQLSWFRRNSAIRWVRNSADARRLVRQFIAAKTSRARGATSGRVRGAAMARTEALVGMRA